MKKQILFLAFLGLFVAPIFAQRTTITRLDTLGFLVRTHLKNAAFPSPDRAEGHDYEGKHYSAEANYSDNTVLVFIPRRLYWGQRTDFIVHFHGWWNSADSVLNTFRLAEQLIAAKKNAILVLPQGPKNAPDSHGGKLEEPGAFLRFMAELADSIASATTKPRVAGGSIILSGHSGAYRVMANILEKGGMDEAIREVWLFDGLYGDTDRFLNWMVKPPRRFVNIFTRTGGTLDNSQALDRALMAKPNMFFYRFGTEATITDDLLKANRIFQIQTGLDHNEVLDKSDLFRRLVAITPILVN